MAIPNWSALTFIGGLRWNFWVATTASETLPCPQCGQPEHGSAACREENDGQAYKLLPRVSQAS